MGRLVLTTAIFLGMFCADGQAHSNRVDQENLDRELRQMAIDGHIPGIQKAILHGAKINSKAAHGEAALEYAIRFGRTGAALKLIELGANPNSADDTGLTPLLRAAGECNASRVVEALLKAGAKVNTRDHYGRTPLMNAAHSNCVRTVAVILLKAKDTVDLEAEDDALETAYDFAREGFVPRMLEIVREYRKTGSRAELAELDTLK